MELEVKNRIKHAVEIYEPRVTAVSVDVDFEPDRNELNCSVKLRDIRNASKFDDISVVFKP